MWKYLILLVWVAGCAGPIGPSGKNGTNGSPGINGSTKFVSGVTCTGTLGSGNFALATITYKAYKTSGGDVLVQVDVSGLNNFNNSSTTFYASTQAGALTGEGFVVIDNSNFFDVSIVSGNLNVVVTSTNGNGGTFNPVGTCTPITFS